MVARELSTDLSAAFRQRLRAALENNEIAASARALGISTARLEAIVPERRALALAESSHHAWLQALQALSNARWHVRLAKAPVLHPPLPRRVVTALRARLPGGAAFSERTERQRTLRLAEIEQRHDIETLAAREESLRIECLDCLDELGILGPLRAYIDERADRAWSTRFVLGPDDAPGLAELRGTASVPLTAIDDVERLIERLPGGSIGISGPRGIGKTTLIHWFTSSRGDPATLVGAYVSAPTRYDPRDFVLHLFATICSAVITEEDPSPWQSTPSTRAIGRYVLAVVLYPLAVGFGALAASVGVVVVSLIGWHADARLLIGLACLGATVTTTMALRRRLRWVRPVSEHSRWPLLRAHLITRSLAAVLFTVGAGLVALSQLASWTPLWAWGAMGAVGAIGLLAAVWPSVSRVPEWFVNVEPSRPYDPRLDPLRHRAHGQLERIRFQMTLTAGWNGTLKLPLLEGGVTGGRSLAARPLTLPELLDELERFIRSAADLGRVVIGIDELDKMESEQDAHRFLNEIKGVFGIRDCFFLVSVSEEAMSNFTRRDVRMRDAFDSAFDEIVHMRPLDLSQSRALLSERVIGLPVQFAALCHVLAGGLPRDVIRAARMVLGLNPQGETTSLAQIVRGVVEQELAMRTRAASIALRNFGPQSTRFVDWLAKLERSVDELADVATDSEVWTRAASIGDDDERQRLIALLLELQGFCYFALTLRDVFDDALDRDAFATIQSGTQSLDALARARTTFSVNSLLGWSEVSAFRRANGLADLSSPEIHVITSGIGSVAQD